MYSSSFVLLHDFFFFGSVYLNIFWWCLIRLSKSLFFVNNVCGSLISLFSMIKSALFHFGWGNTKKCWVLICRSFLRLFLDSHGICYCNLGFNCGEAANFGTSKGLNVAKEAAVRRAAMNHLPMLSHQQLLYLLTMSFASRLVYDLSSDSLWNLSYCVNYFLKSII